MDSLTDIGVIEASYDSGMSWVSLNDTSIFASFFMWESDYHESTGTYTPHLLTTTGKSDGWIRSTFLWQWSMPVRTDTIIIPPSSLMVRFTFMSDSINNNKEGWMIDDITILSNTACSSIEEWDNKNFINVSPNPFREKTVLHTNFKLKNGVMILYNTFGQEVYREVNCSGNRFILNRNELPSGIYNVCFLEDNQMIARKKILIIN